MKIKILVSGICAVTIILVVSVVIITRMKNSVDPSFATEVNLKYYYVDNEIDVKIADTDDIQKLKENLKGVSYKDSPSCGFDLNISITFSDGEKSITLCPACDDCWKARVGDSNKYIDIKDRRVFESIVAKYGMMFPCV